MQKPRVTLTFGIRTFTRINNQEGPRSYKRKEVGSNIDIRLTNPSVPGNYISWSVVGPFVMRGQTVPELRSPNTEVYQLYQHFAVLIKFMFLLNRVSRLCPLAPSVSLHKSSKVNTETSCLNRFLLKTFTDIFLLNGIFRLKD